LDRILAVSLAAALVICGIACTPIANMPLMPIPGYMAAFGTSMIVINLLLAALLFSQGTIEGQSSAVRLGTAYFFIAVIVTALVAAFPGIIVQTSLIGGPSSGVWLWSYWHAGFGLGVIRYALGRDGVPSSVMRSIVAVLVVATVLTLTATVGLPYLPLMLADGHTLFTGFGAIVPPAILAILAVALLLVLRMQTASRERLWLAAGLVAAGFDVWLTYRGTDRYSLGWYLSKCGSLITSLVLLISLLHEVTMLRHQAAAANRALSMLAHQDGLTGLVNRRRFDELLDVEWRRARRDAQSISLLMIDVDYFKNFNDRYGHLQGDDCLRQLGGTLQSVIRRPADSAARYGGEEFVLLLPGTDAAGAMEVARLVHARLRAIAMPHGASPLSVVTASIGVGTLLPKSDLGHEKLLSIADDNLYRAKAAGRNTTRADEVLAAV
jgi:diguanylate cyclase (GGDEF)-like protein